ncbi:leucyl/phenylalanyl-tRNA--protein transferase [Castellaniella hirudinis]|uniref:leucyl/phenylalanyl-tRNA--protein transferase n=1 Tax=Castellaniella hirudinis TaxID=1144617 RepID=UPI0039C47867
MTIPWLDPDSALPDASQALPGGLLAAGLDLSPRRLREAYGKGAFPWYSPGEPVLWWSPDPRMVLQCNDFHISRSLAKRMRQFRHSVTLNQAFPQVIAHCARRGTPRLPVGAARTGQAWQAPGPAEGRDATWITPDIAAAYTAWHRQGRVHSVETWIDGRLAGGLYGVSLGQCFFGESMFSLAADTSKVALAFLVRYLQAHGVPWIDCQQETPHLASLGARPIPRARFLALLAAGRDAPAPPWGAGRLGLDGQCQAIDPPV